VEHLAGRSVEAADDVALGDSLGGETADVGLGALITAKAHHDDAPECVVGDAIATTVALGRELGRPSMEAAPALWCPHPPGVPHFIPQLGTLPASTQWYPAAPPPLRPSSRRPCTASSNTSLPVLKPPR
jgi:hypothetical protein